MFEWDEEKRQANLRKHGVDFLRARVMFDGRNVLTIESPYPFEKRFLSTAQLGHKFYTVVWTERGDKKRFISARRARDEEERAYRQLYG
jgi:uncharacterized DUF497 family protein